MHSKVKVVIEQVGSPKSTEIKDVRSYLKEFLGKPRVIDVARQPWWVILNLFILPFSPKVSAALYRRLKGNSNCFPLLENTQSFAEVVKKNLDENIELDHCYAFSYPRFKDIFSKWESEDQDNRADKFLMIPQFPQYSESTSAGASDGMLKSFSGTTNVPAFEFYSNYHKLKAFIDLSVKKITETVSGQKLDALILSFHGMPLRRIIQKEDRYYLQCYETYKLIADQLVEKNIFTVEQIHFCFQSRFGSEQWIGPATDEYAVELVEKGSKHLACYCPSFVVDCLETTDEIGHELRHDVEGAGGDLVFIPCLNDDEDWAYAYAAFINTYINGSKTDFDQLFYTLDPKESRNQMPEQEQKSPPLTPYAKKNIKIVFLTLFMDLVGFSIIFPLFPSLAKHYLEVDADNIFLKVIFDSINAFANVGGGSNISSIVLFGGALGALYSLLQFVAAPIWGNLSDRFGRKPILLVSVFGLFISYVLWIFSGSFTLLIVARIIGGVMGGNISTATAVVADVTDTSNRSKGMAFVGIAFATGFIFGPAMGGILSFVDLTQIYPASTEFGINPFSMPAILAAVLSFINLIYIYFKFEETLPKEKRGQHATERSANPFAIFKPLASKNVNLTNYTHFLFLSAFSGMEFTLTFLAMERLGYDSMDNAYMFIFIGVVLALIQGGYVRRKAHIIGEKAMAMRGLISIIPGLIILAFANSSGILYLGLFFLSIGGAMVIPTLTSLVTIYTPAHQQGHSIGIFRSLGALARVVGPITAAVLYWKYGSHVPYIAGAIFLLFPILLVTKLGKVGPALK